MRQTWHQREIEVRRERYERQLRPIYLEHTSEDATALDTKRREKRRDIVPVIARFVEGGHSAEELRAAIQDWSAR